MIYILPALLLLCCLAVYAFMLRPEFGKRPKGESLGRIRRSPHFKRGQFQNLSHTPSLAEGANFFSVLFKFLFKKSPRTKPSGRIPSVKTDLKALDPQRDLIVWFGHSSYLLQIDGKRILVDPVFSGSASPVAGTTRSFEGSDAFSANDMPEIDILLLSHDHWDHLDYETVSMLRPKIRQVLTGLGTGAHLKSWGFDAGIIHEKDWYESVGIGNFTFHFTPARHFSGRGLRRNGSLWTSFALETPARKLYLGGDSGYDAHFTDIGKRFGPFDLAVLECGQYNHDWPFIHMFPEQVVEAARDLGAKAVLPVHWAKFSLAPHAWDEPIRRVVEASTLSQTALWTPKIGEVVDFDNVQVFEPWWETVG